MSVLVLLSYATVLHKDTCGIITAFDSTRINQRFLQNIRPWFNDVAILWNNQNTTCAVINNITCINTTRDRLDNKYHIPLILPHCKYYVLFDDDVTFDLDILDCMRNSILHTTSVISAPVSSMRYIDKYGMKIGKIKAFHAAIPQLIYTKRQALEMYKTCVQTQKEQINLCDDFSFANCLFKYEQRPIIGIVGKTHTHHYHRNSLSHSKTHLIQRSSCVTTAPNISFTYKCSSKPLYNILGR